MSALIKGTKSLAQLILVAGLFITGPSLAANDEQRLQKLQQDITTLRSNLSSNKQEQSKIQENLKKLDKE
ncbi:hypothetical protein ACFL2V_08515, partial [Pseudomonadota bacterium]